MLNLLVLLCVLFCIANKCWFTYVLLSLFENHLAWFIVIELNMVKNFNEIATAEKIPENLILNHGA